jgi:hypothetical protein
MTQNISTFRSIHAVHVTPINPKGRGVVAYLGDGVSVPSQDYGWQVTQRPRREGFTEWTGTGPMVLSVPLVFDGFANNHSVMADCYRLEEIAATPVGVRKEPAVVRISGAVWHNKRDWIISNIEWGDQIRRPSDGHLVRAFFTLTLTEYVEADVVIKGGKSPAKTARSTHHGTTTKKSVKTYTVKAGDTLTSIAAHQLHDYRRWKEIATLNKLRNPNSLRVGQKLKMPS